MKILVVDDMPSMRKVLIYMLDSLGYTEIGEAGNGMQALSMLMLDNYDLLITDLNMPHLDGKQLLNKIRKDEVLHSLPVLMMSCEDDKSKVMDLINCDVTGFMVKPFNISTLKKQLAWTQHKIQAA